MTQAFPVHLARSWSGVRVTWPTANSGCSGTSGEPLPHLDWRPGACGHRPPYETMVCRFVVIHRPNIRRSAGLLTRTLMLFALAIQLTLPAVMLHVTERAGAIDLDHATICRYSTLDVSGSGPDDRPGIPRECGICPVCRIGAQSGAFLLPGQTNVLPPAQTFWLTAGQPVRVAAPRGLPRFRAHARSPPVLS